MTGFERAKLDSSFQAQTPEGIEFTIYPAGIFIRGCAWAIDALIQGILVLIFVISGDILRWALGYWFTLILIFALDWFYHTAFEVFARGQSPGKRFMGIQVLRSDGTPVNAGASFLRNLLRFADAFMFLYLIAFLCSLVSPAFRRTGDWAGDTLVVYTAAARTPGRFTSPALKRPVMPWLADIPQVYPERKLSYEEKQAILSFARRYPLLGKSRADEIAEIWTDKLKSAESGADVSESTARSASAYLLGVARTLGG